MNIPVDTGECRSSSPFIRSMSPSERRVHMATIGARGNAERIVLNGEERQALSAAYALLRRVAERHPSIMEPPAEGDSGAEK